MEGIKPAYICSLSPQLSLFCCLFVCFSITRGVVALQSEITWSGASFCIAGLLTPWQNKMYYNNNVFNYLWVYCFERSSCLFCRCKKYSCAPNLWEYSLFNSNVLFSTEPFCYANRREAQILYLTLLVFWRRISTILCYASRALLAVLFLVFVFGGLVIVGCVSVLRQAEVSAVLMVVTGWGLARANCRPYR